MGGVLTRKYQHIQNYRDGVHQKSTLLALAFFRLGDNRHSMAENQIEADGYSRYTSNPTDQQPKRKTLCESGMLTADQLMQQLNEDEKRRKASYSMLMRTGEEPKPSTLSVRLQNSFLKYDRHVQNEIIPLQDASSYIPSSMSRRDEPVYYSRDSRTRLLHSQSSNVLNKEQVRNNTKYLSQKCVPTPLGIQTATFLLWIWSTTISSLHF